MAQAPYMPGRMESAAGGGPSAYYPQQHGYGGPSQQPQHQAPPMSSQPPSHHQYHYNARPRLPNGAYGQAKSSAAPKETRIAGGNKSNQVSVQNDFRKLELVGRGAYGAVYRGAHIASGKAVALKVVNLDTPDDDVSDIQREVALLSSLRETTTKNVIKYWGCWLLGAELWIVMDYAEGGSIRTIMNAGPVAEKYAVVIVRESLIALNYLHKLGIIHRDIKAANVLLTNAGDVLLCDFGVAATFVSSSVHSRRTTFVGTPYWMAPEVITQGKSYDQSADIWSLGITIYEMCTGNPPYADQEQMRAIMMIPKNKPARLPADGPFSQLMREFVALCLNEEPRERPGADELSKTKWIKASSKVPNSILRDLITAYTSWCKTGGMRMSLLGAETTDLNDATNRDSFAFDGHETSEGWEFSSASFEDFSAEHEPVAPYAPPRDHPLLRLFEQDDGEAQSSITPNRGLPQAQSQSTALQYKGAEIRPAPAPPGPMPERSPAEAAPSSASMSASQSRNENTTKPLSLPNEPAGGDTAPAAGGAGLSAAAAAAAAAAADKKAFTGTGATPFRFGGGGGMMSEATSPLPYEQPSNDATLRTRAGSVHKRDGSLASGGEHGRAASNDADISAAYERRRDAHKRQGSIMSSRTNSISVDGPGPNHGLSRHFHTRSNSNSVYSHSPGASEGSAGLGALQGFRPPGSMGDMTAVGASRSNGHLVNMAPSMSTDVMPSESFPSGLQARSQSAAPMSSRSNGAPAPSTFFDGQHISSSPASDFTRLPSSSALAAAAAMPPPPQPGLSGRPIGVGMRSRSGSRSRPWQSASESDAAAAIDFAGLPPVPRRGALAKHLGVAMAGASQANGSAPTNGANSASHLANGSTPFESSLLASPPALHQRRQHGGSDPTQAIARRPSRDVLNGGAKGDAAANGAQDVTTDSPSRTQLALPNGGLLPGLHGLNIGALTNKDDVYLELDRTVESLGCWLDVVGGGLARVVGSS